MKKEKDLKSGKSKKTSRQQFEERNLENDLEMEDGLGKPIEESFRNLQIKNDQKNQEGTRKRWACKVCTFENHKDL